MDAMLFGAVFQLHQAELVEPSYGNSACQGRLRHGVHARSHFSRLPNSGAATNLFRDVERRVVYRRQAQLPPGFERRRPTASSSSRIATRTPSLRVSRTAETDRGPSPRLQLERHVFEDVGQIGAASQSFEKTAPLADAATMFDHLGQPAHHAIIEAGHLVGCAVLQVTQFDPGPITGRRCQMLGPRTKNLPKFHIQAVSGRFESPTTAAREQTGVAGKVAENPDLRRERPPTSGSIARVRFSGSLKYIGSKIGRTANPNCRPCQHASSNGPLARRSIDFGTREGRNRPFRPSCTGKSAAIWSPMRRSSPGS